MINRVRLFRELWASLGPRWLAFRIWYATSIRLGIIQRRTPHIAWDDQPDDLFRDGFDAVSADYLLYRQKKAPSFFFQPANRKQYRQQLLEFDSEENDPVSIAEELIEGKFRYFSDMHVDLGFPPDWHTNPFTGEKIPPINHWSYIDDFENGDIRIIWELNRFGFSYTLVRAYWRTDDVRYAEAFWRLVEDWRKNNPPQLGPNWRCGQETSFRVMAWCFGLYGFLDSPATTPDRVRKLGEMIAVSAQRIEANIEYALSQRNNHGISEGMGLWTIGILFPELKSASSWKQLGRKVLEAQGLELIYDDGSFSQHSSNYHRVMLHDYLWCIRLGDLSGDRLSSQLRDRLATAVDFLFQMQVGNEGQVPNVGQNDGSLILLLNNCSFQDIRPTIQSMGFLCYKENYYHYGPWDEDLLWLFGPEAITDLIKENRNSDLGAEDGGYYSIRQGQSFALIRSPNYRHRPSHADALHLDIWWKGQNIAQDAGSYSYNAPNPWNNPLAATNYHNTVTVDGYEQMNRASRYLWIPWLRCSAQAFRHSDNRELVYWQGEHDGYRRLDPPVRYQRGVLYIGKDSWLVLDRLSSTSEHDYRLHWLITDGDYDWNSVDGRFRIQTPNGEYNILIGSNIGNSIASLVRADESTARGWRSSNYYRRQPALSIAAKEKSQNLLFYSFLGPTNSEIDIRGNEMIIENSDVSASIQFLIGDATMIIEKVDGSWSGRNESLDLTT